MYPGHLYFCEKLYSLGLYVSFSKNSKVNTMSSSAQILTYFSFTSCLFHQVSIQLWNKIIFYLDNRFEENNQYIFKYKYFSSMHFFSMEKVHTSNYHPICVFINTLSEKVDSSVVNGTYCVQSVLYVQQYHLNFKNRKVTKENNYRLHCFGNFLDPI